MYNVLEAFFIEIPSWEGTYPLNTYFLLQDQVIGWGFIIITIHQYLVGKCRVVKIQALQEA